ncbi:kinetochore protein Nuf2-B-like [Centruroides sculpturatus]|uniref:kinetochore protein Nuf2-B-like n=1 Tax=Centruroides sculpturatus TaxID=218467 RepID=UPI000C6D0CE2|nr:kinetochore protein Nuf2-B-like [Centruroides sculpturatus]
MNLADEDRARIPILPEEKLIEFLNRFLYLNISKEDLNNPEVVVLVFETFLKDFGYNIDALNQLNWNASNTFEGNIENYEETIPLLNLLVVMKVVATRCSINDFTVRDIMEPKRKRTRRILSYFANYWQFSVKNLEMWVKAKEKYSEAAKRKKELMNDIDRIKQQINEKRIQLTMNSAQDSEIEEECKTYVENLKKIMKTKDEVTEKYQKLKQKFAERKSYVSNINVEIASCIEKKKELESKIVSSEQRQELEDLADKLQLYYQKNEEIFSKIDEYKKSRNTHVKVQDKLNKALEFLNNLNKEINKDRMVTAKLEDITNSNKTEIQKSENLQRQLDQKNSELTHLEEWNQREELKHKKQIEELKSLIGEQEKCMENNQGEVLQKLLSEKHRITNRIQKHKDERKELDQEVAKMTLSMSKTFENFGISVAERLEVIREDLEELQKREINFDE